MEKISCHFSFFFLAQQCETPSKRISIKHLFLPLVNKYRQFQKIYTKNLQKLFLPL